MIYHPPTQYHSFFRSTPLFIHLWQEGLHGSDQLAPAQIKKLMMIRWAQWWKNTPITVSFHCDLMETCRVPLKHCNLQLNPFTAKILLEILLSVCYSILLMLIQRIWYLINLLFPNWNNFLFPLLICWILYWYWKEKYCLGQMWDKKR